MYYYSLSLSMYYYSVTMYYKVLTYPNVFGEFELYSTSTDRKAFYRQRLAGQFMIVQYFFIFWEGH